MKIKVSCTSCGQNVLVESSGDAYTINCPSCGKELIIPEVIIQSAPSPSPPQIKIPAQKQRSIGWGVFWGLFGFFIILPLVVLVGIAFFTLVPAFLKGREQAQTNAALSTNAPQTTTSPRPKKKISEIALGNNLKAKRDEVRNITFIEPVNTETIPEGLSCYLYVSDNEDGTPALFLRCRTLSDDIFHFDQVVFRIGETVHTIKHQTFELMQTDRLDKKSYGHNDFLVMRGSNLQAVKTLLLSENEQTVRFHSSTYNRSKDFTLSKSDLNIMRSVFMAWSDVTGD